MDTTLARVRHTVDLGSSGTGTLVNPHPPAIGLVAADRHAATIAPAIEECRPLLRRLCRAIYPRCPSTRRDGMEAHGNLLVALRLFAGQWRLTIEGWVFELVAQAAAVASQRSTDSLEFSALPNRLE